MSEIILETDPWQFDTREWLASRIEFDRTLRPGFGAWALFETTTVAR